uniref:Uncharacterized protein n=1 Tax=Meloidogyne javanica TaxID=6303 RepID=A0A915LPT3_MELJA
MGDEYFEVKEENNEKNSQDLIKNMDRMEVNDAEETPSTTTKAKMSKKKRDREKKKILESKNLGKESVDESLDIEMKDVEEEESNLETPSTTTKAKMSKKKRDREKKKNLELKILEKESADGSFDTKMKDIEEEVHPKIIEENISMGSDETTVTEAVKGEVERPKIGEQKTAENLEEAIADVIKTVELWWVYKERTLISLEKQAIKRP